MGTTGQLSPTGRGQNWCGEGAWCKDISQQPDTPALLKETGGLGLPWGFGTSVGEASCCPVLRTTRHLHPKYITASQETHGYNALKGVEEIKSRIDVMVNVLQAHSKHVAWLFSTSEQGPEKSKITCKCTKQH